MPELPEVEFARRKIERVGKGRRIADVRTVEDRKVFDGIAPRAFTRQVKGRRLVRAHRRGKQLWWELDARPWPLFHLGMTGQFIVRGEKGLPLRANIDEGEDWPPRHWKALFEFEDGGAIAYTNARRFGRVRMREDPESEPPVSELGFDPLTSMPTQEDFEERLRKRRGKLKGLLLDQSFAAGVGNWFADEVLYQAGLDPRRDLGSLDASEVSRLRTKLRYVARKSCEVDADKARFPRTWLFHHRWDAKQKDARTARGEPIRFGKVSGRATAWVPSRQS